MIVYVESNFILELVRGQKQSRAAETILQLAENRKIELVFPSFALGETFANVVNRERNQERLSKSLEGMLDELPIMLSEAARRERDNLWSTVSRLVDAGVSIETNTICLNQALDYQKRLRLTQQDSIIYSATIIDMQQRPFKETKCFLNSNSKDFKVEAILSELNSYNCHYEQNFGKGLNYIQISIMK
jgi:predicted nucleic acid-binding protein